MLSTNISEKGAIREMDADELQQHAQKVYNDLNWYGPNEERSDILTACKKQYRQLTGTTLKLTYTPA